MRKLLFLLILVLICISGAVAEDHVHAYYPVSEVVEPTCDEDGYSLYVCDCGAVVKAGTIPALGHDWGEPTMSYDEELGLARKTSICQRCGMQRVEVIESEPVFTCKHQNTEMVMLANVDMMPTCSNQGTAHMRCTECKKVVEAVIVPALGHLFGESQLMIAPTCTGTGLVRLVCVRENCDRLGEWTRYEESAALGHDFSNGNVIIAMEPDCIHQGTQQVQCARCEAMTIETLPALGHDFTTVMATAPDCVNDGIMRRICERCL